MSLINSQVRLTIKGDSSLQGHWLENAPAGRIKSTIRRPAPPFLEPKAASAHNPYLIERAEASLHYYARYISETYDHTS